MKSFLVASLIWLPFAAGATTPANPILYVTQMPLPDELLNHSVIGTKMSIASTMQSPLADPAHAGRGGALWIRYPNGTTKNLTEAAGYGGPMDASHNASGLQGAGSIAVHRPFMHWSGTKAIFGMVVGAPLSAADTTVFHWQLYEITGFGQGQNPVVTRVLGQPAGYNNFEACYDTQDRIIFVSDAPHGLQAHLYPQLDEYMDTPTNTGLWRLDRANAGELKQIIHAPSGAFTPFLDSAGRVLFVQWDHLSRDVSATYDRPALAGNGETWTQTFNGNGTYDSEAVSATFTHGTPANYATFNHYPEPRNFDKTALLALGNVNGNAMNQFFPWECHEDGSAHEIINHVGRHEFGGSSLGPSFKDDPNLVLPTFTNPTTLSLLHLIESPVTHGTFFAVNPPELGTHMAGNIIRFNGGAGVNPSTMVITLVSPLANVPNPNPALNIFPLTTPANVYRNPLPLSDGTLLAVHAAVTQVDSNVGADAQHPKSRFDFKMKMLNTSGATAVPDANVTLVTEPNVNLSYYANGLLITYSGAPLWELDPIEVVAPFMPTPLAATPIPSVEQAVFDEEGVHAPTLQNYLRAQNLALVVNRDSTRRDAADKQQPFNLKVATSPTQTLGASGKIYDIGWMQIMQADALRGFTLSSDPAAPPLPGRRDMPVPLHDTLAEMPAISGSPSGSVKIADDGSWAAILPAGKALTWHMLNGAGTASQVKERYWVNFAPGEVRSCVVCHGVNTQDQAGNLGVPFNKPQALRDLLQFWKNNHPPGTVQHAAAASAVLKSAAIATIAVTRTGGSTGPASVNFSTANGTAVAGVDFFANAGTLAWTDGDASPKPVQILLKPTSVITSSKSLSVTLSNPTYASLGSTMLNTLTLTETPFDAWRFANFGSNANVAGIGLPGDDADSDGQDNQSEFLAGTLPTDPTSVFVLRASMAGSQVHLGFTALPGVSYTVQFSDDMSQNTWHKLTDVPAPGAAQAEDIVDPAIVPHRFYRAVTPLQP
ncbi:MAG: Calx-beta domain-containing protein [Luteolibacter sp.]